MIAFLVFAAAVIGTPAGLVFVRALRTLRN